MALVLPFNDSSCDAALPHIQRVLAAHGVVALPTETYYGLAVRPTDEEALRRLVEVKDRPPDKPLLVLIGAPEQLVPLVEAITPAASLLMEWFWPGPLTIVFPAASGLSPLLTAGSGTVGVRWSPLPVLQRLLTHTGPLPGTSANRSSEPPLADPGAVQDILGSSIDPILDGGLSPGGPASTVIDACEGPRLRRAGVIATDRMRAVLERSGYTLSS